MLLVKSIKIELKINLRTLKMKLTKNEEKRLVVLDKCIQGLNVIEPLFQKAGFNYIMDEGDWGRAIEDCMNEYRALFNKKENT